MTTTMEAQKQMRKIVYLWAAQMGNLVVVLLWHLLHFLVSLWMFSINIVMAFESYLISFGILRKYKIFNVANLRHLAIVVDSEEASDISSVIKLLKWVTSLGVKNICLYDPKGVLKKNKQTITESLQLTKSSEDDSKNVPFLNQKNVCLDFACLSDGKEAMAKSAGILFKKYYLGGNPLKQTFTEEDIAEALETIGSGGADPNLMLIYGPTRCHLGYPAWRIRYTEMAHMGSLKSLKYGSLLKVVRKFTMVNQNYGK
ncbi:dehydrodolichyl diphosphate synthase complex subunit NUS1-like [Impatiens glandulifera]|uniref:dehydrodolichyl diphosphate synthase complex subunit NUS1-like n=1 Tax=Impatiens glandulifera TaxID=253017 RepID=UPI001FB0A795|nr:dehydrodolichyl diphosphate synthase complex subunit NUS1-like [Impatiens glandulifera]XP_047313805.1 dehydrodolichyl diphosphate synthase complex subunit NUS1-like [Impatiens glandulifera]